MDALEIALIGPEAAAYQRRFGNQQMMEGTSGAPVQHWTQALNRVAQGAVGGMREAGVRENEQRAAEMRKQALMNALNGGDMQGSAMEMLGNPATEDMGMQLAQNVFSQRQAEAAAEARAREARAAEDRDFTRHKELIKFRESMRPTPAPQQTPHDRANLAVQYGLDPSSPEGRAFILTGKMPKAEEQGLSARGEKAVFEADDMIESNRSAIDNLDRAIKVNEKAFSSFGPLNDNIGYMMSFTGSEAGKATQELDNIVKTNALESLKATFGGMPTEGERKVLIEVQGSLGQPAEVRAEIYKRAKALAERRLAYNSWKARALRDGTYFTQIPPNFADIVKTETGNGDAKANLKQKYGLE